MDYAAFSQLIDASAMLVSSFDTKDILPKGMQIIKQLLKCEAASIMLADENGKNLIFEVALGEKGKELEQIAIPLGKGIAGEVALKGEPLIVPDAYAHIGFDPSYDKKTGFKTKSILCVPLKFNRNIVGVAQAINPEKKACFDEEDALTLSLFANQVALVAEGAKLHKKILVQQRVENELRLARTIQESFLPQSLPPNDAFSFQACSLPAREVGGDFYDFFSLPNGNIAFVIGDVSGKGVGAALMMAKTLSEVKIIAGRESNLNNPALTLKELNQSLCRRRSMGMFVTMSYGIINIKNHIITLSSAGHPFPYLRQDKKIEWQSLCVPNGLPVGIDEKAKYSNMEIILGTKDTLFFYTDGITEACDKNGREFIHDLFAALKTKSNSTSDLSDTTREMFKAFCAQAKFLDDATWIFIQRA